MPYGRYNRLGIVDNVRRETFRFKVGPLGYTKLDLSTNIQTFEYTVKEGDRIDVIAARTLGDDSYWPVIALLNNITYPLGTDELYAGRVLKIPLDAREAAELMP